MTNILTQFDLLKGGINAALQQTKAGAHTRPLLGSM